MTYMLLQEEEKIAAEWRKYQGYTVRPLPSTISYYEEIIATYSAKARYLLYGGTPEIRSLFQKFGYPLSLVDRSAPMVRALGQLTEAQRPLADNEQLLQQDWLHLDGLGEPFDFLIGDDAINMVTWPQFELFLQQAWRRLRPGGLFVCHLLVKPCDSLIQTTLPLLEQEFRNGSIQSRYDLASRLNFLCWDKNTYAMGWQQTIAHCGAVELNRFKPELDFIDTFGFCNSRFYCPPLPLFEALVEKYFTIREVFYPHEHEYCLFEPVYTLERK